MSDSEFYLDVLDNTLWLPPLESTRERSVEEMIGDGFLMLHRKTALAAVFSEHGEGAIDFAIASLPALYEAEILFTYHEELIRCLATRSQNSTSRLELQVPKRRDLDASQALEFWRNWRRRHGANTKYSTLAWHARAPRTKAAFDAYLAPKIDMKHASDDDVVVRLAATRNPGIDAAALSLFVRDAEPHVRLAVVMHPRATTQTLRILLNDENSIVRRWIANNPNSDDSILQILSEDKDPAVVKFLAANAKSARSRTGDERMDYQIPLVNIPEPEATTISVPGSSSASVKPSLVLPEDHELFSAVRNGRHEVVRCLLQTNPILACARDEEGKTALHYASELPYLEGQFKAACELVSHGADVNAQDTHGATPLHWLACGLQGYGPQFAKLLIENGADIHIASEHGDTPESTSERWSGLLGTPSLSDIVRWIRETEDL